MASGDPHPPVPIPTVTGNGIPPVPMPSVGPGPGPRPVAPVFPFAEARAAKHALDTVLDDLRQLASQHRSLTHALLGDGTFSGSARATFETNITTAVSDLSPGATATLEAKREWLVQEIAAAHARQDAYEQDLAAWQARVDHPNPSVPV